MLAKKLFFTFLVINFSKVLHCFFAIFLWTKEARHELLSVCGTVKLCKCYKFSVMHSSCTKLSQLLTGGSFSVIVMTAVDQ